MIDRKTRVILALIFCPISGIPTYVTMCALMHTPVTWVYWIGLVVTQCAGCTVAVFYQDIVHGMALLITRKSRLAQIRMAEEIEQRYKIWSGEHKDVASRFRLRSAKIEQRYKIWSGEHGPELAYISPSMAMQEVNQALTLMARVVYHQPEPELRYELVMHDEGMVSGNDEVDHGKVGVN